MILFKTVFKNYVSKWFFSVLQLQSILIIFKFRKKNNLRIKISKREEESFKILRVMNYHYQLTCWFRRGSRSFGESQTTKPVDLFWWTVDSSRNPPFFIRVPVGWRTSPWPIPRSPATTLLPLLLLHPLQGCRSLSLPSQPRELDFESVLWFSSNVKFLKMLLQFGG